MEFGYFTLSDNRYPGQPALGRAVHQGHLRRGAVRREGRAELGLDRRASFQPSGRQRLAAGDAGAARRRHDQAPAGARRDAAAGASSAACRRGMGDARPAVGRPGRFRRRPRLRPQGVRAVPGAVRRVGRAVRRGAGDRVARLDRAGQVVHKGKFYQFKDVEIRPQAGAAAAAALRGLLLAAVDGACGQERLERDLRAVRGGHGLWLAGRCGARLSRDLRDRSSSGRCGGPCAPTSCTSPRRRRRSSTARKRWCAISRTR